MPSAIPINLPNPPPTNRGAALSAFRITTDIKNTSRRAIKGKWNAGPEDFRANILHYFNRLPGKFKLTQDQITEYSEQTFNDLPSNVQQKVLKAVTGWRWDYELRDPMPAAMIAYGMGGFNLSRAGELSVMLFNDLPNAFITKLTDTYAVWDDIKNRTELGEGALIQTVSAAVRRTRSYGPWRTRWDALGSEQRTFLLYAVNISLVSNVDIYSGSNPLAERAFNSLPATVKRHLHDNVELGDVDNKINTGKVIWLKRIVIRASLGSERVRTVKKWPGSKKEQYAFIVYSWWDELSPLLREEVLSFIKENDAALTQSYQRHHPVWEGSDLRELAGMSIFGIYRSLGSASNRSMLLGHLGLFLLHKMLFRYSPEERTATLVGMDQALPIIPVAIAPLDSVARLDRVYVIAETINGLFTGNQAESYKAFIGVMDNRKWIRKLLYNIQEIEHYKTAGANVTESIRGLARVREMATFEPGQEVRIEGVANYCKVDDLEPTSFDAPKYNIKQFKGYPYGSDPSRGDFLMITNIEQDRLSPWGFWSWEYVISGRLWNDHMNRSNRQWWISSVASATISSDHEGLPGPRGVLVTRDWARLGDITRQKIIIWLAGMNLIEGIKWATYTAEGDIRDPPPETLWDQSAIRYRKGAILYGMSVFMLEETETRVINPTNEVRLGEVERRAFFRLPLDYIHGLTVLQFEQYRFEEEHRRWGDFYFTLNAKWGTMGSEDRIYYAIGSGFDPQVASAMTRPHRTIYNSLPEWKQFKLLEALVKHIDETEGMDIARDIQAIIDRGREMAPELPEVSAEDELASAWGGLSYEEKFRAVAGAFEFEVVQAAYRGNDWTPPSTYIRAASSTELSRISDREIVQALTMNFEARNRDLAPIIERGGQTIQRLSDELNQTRTEGESRADGTASTNWSELNRGQRGLLANYIHEEIDQQVPVSSGEWPDLTNRLRGHLIDNLDNWTTFITYGAALVLENWWSSANPAKRQRLMLGSGVAINRAQLTTIMAQAWDDYTQVPRTYTKPIIDSMAQGIDDNYGLLAINVMTSRAAAPINISETIQREDVRVGDFIKVRYDRRTFFGVIVNIDKHVGNVPMVGGSQKGYWANWNQDFFQSLDNAAVITASRLHEPMTIIGVFSHRTMNQDIERYMEDYALPVLRDGWGGESEVFDIRAQRVAKIMLDLKDTELDELLAHLYPTTGALPRVFMRYSAWSNMPSKLRSRMIRNVVEEAFATPSYLRELIDTRISSAPQQGNFRNWIMMLGGVSLLNILHDPTEWLPSHYPLIAYAINKARRDVAAPPTAQAPPEREVVPEPPPEEAIPPEVELEEEEEEELFDDPFTDAIHGHIAAGFWRWPRAQLVATNDAAIQRIIDVLREQRKPHYMTIGGGQGIPVTFALFPMTTSTARDLSIHLRGNRLWNRVKSSVRSRGGQALVSIQVGEFYKFGKNWKENTVKWKRLKKKSKVVIFPIGKYEVNENPADFNVIRFRTDVHPISAIKDFLEEHAEGWVTSFTRHYNLGRLPKNKRVYVALLKARHYKKQPFRDKIMAVMGITQNKYDNLSDIFVAVSKRYRRTGVARQMFEELDKIARSWVNPETGRTARRIWLMVKQDNVPSNRMVRSLGFEKDSDFINQEGETVNKYVKELYDPPRENP